MKSNYFKSDLDYEDLLMHSVCRFDKDVKFNPLDVDNFLKLTDYIEWCITENILYTDVEAQIDALKYFYRKVENGLEVFYNVQDLMRIENSKRILKWIEKRRKKLKKTQSNNRDNLKETKADALTSKENLYNEYFKGNTFLLFKAYCDEYNIDNTCRTDLSVLFQLFTEHEYFVDTMELKHYLKFLNKEMKYDSTELKKVILNTKPNIVRTKNFNRIKNNLKLTLK